MGALTDKLNKPMEKILICIEDGCVYFMREGEVWYTPIGNDYVADVSEDNTEAGVVENWDEANMSEKGVRAILA